MGKLISCTVTGRHTRLTSKSSCKQISSAKRVSSMPSRRLWDEPALRSTMVGTAVRGSRQGGGRFCVFWFCFWCFVAFLLVWAVFFRVFCTSRGAMCAGSAQVTLIELRRSCYTGCIPTAKKNPQTTKHHSPKRHQKEETTCYATRVALQA